MIKLFKSKKEHIPEIRIDCSDNAIHINNVEIQLPVHLNILKEVFGEPSKQDHNLLWP
ncbi:DUF7738 domain-containing protein [Sinomicrobium sp. M5D2P9]